MRILSIIFNSFLWSIVISITIFNNTWIEMRVNVGLVLFLCWATIFIVGVIIRCQWRLRFCIINFVICMIYSLILLGGERLKVVPAAIIREGLGFTNISFSIINITVSIFITLLFLLILFIEFQNRRK